MKVFFSQKMVADSGSYSPSAGKPALAVASWRKRGFAIDVIEPTPASLAQLYRAHNADHVNDVMACKKYNGFGNKNRSVADSLLYTVGAMIEATHEAFRSGFNTCAPVSGFHHAGWDYSDGYCTFNGLMVAALDLLERTGASRVGILDLDQHYGDGTENIIEKLGLNSSIIHYSAGLCRADAVDFLNELPALINDLYTGCNVLIYQAGADPHINDPLGGWMTTEQLYERDVIVFEAAKRLKVPVAFDLAGGYQKDRDGGISPVLKIHDNTMAACLGTWEPNIK